MSKILFITSLDSDYLQDLTYRGLIDKYGIENVIDYPWNLQFHWPKRDYPRNLGFKNINFQHSLQKLRRLEWSKIQLVIVAAAKPDCFETYQKLQSQIPSSVPVIFLDGGDYADVGGDLQRLKCPALLNEVQAMRPFDFIFKREMLIEKDYPKNVAPLLFAVPTTKIIPHNFSDDQLNYLVSFWAVESDPVRTLALGKIEDKFDCRENGTTKSQVFKKYKRKGMFYLEELARCKIILNFRGVGWDTLRYWEVFGLGRFMISQKPQIKIPDNFEHGKEIIFCKDDCSDLIELCEHYLTASSERELIAKAGYAKAQKYHSESARVEYLFKTLQAAKIL